MAHRVAQELGGHWPAQLRKRYHLHPHVRRRLPPRARESHHRFNGAHACAQSPLIGNGDFATERFSLSVSDLPISVSP